MDVSEIKKKLDDLSNLIQEWEDKRQMNDRGLLQVAEICKQVLYYREMVVSCNPELRQRLKKKLKLIFRRAKAVHYREESKMEKVIGLVDNIQNEWHLLTINAESSKSHPKTVMMSWLSLYAKTMPVHLGKYGEPAPPLCGAIAAPPGYVAEVNDLVAARVKADREFLWIISRVLEYDSLNDSFVVRDIYEKDKTHALKRKDIIPMPKTAANPFTNPEALFPKDTKVLAVWPQVTTFYSAVVKEPPVMPNEGYQLLFEDDRYGGFDPDIYTVCQKFVISLDNVMV